MFDNLAKALGWSALLHLLVIAVLWYTHRPAKVVAQPRAIEAFVYQAIRPKPPAVTPKEVAPVKPALKPIPKPTPTAVKAKPVVEPAKPITAQRTADQPADVPANKAIDNNSTPTEATHVTNPAQEPHAMSLAERSLAIATRRHNDISNEALAASQQRPHLRDRPATTSKVQLKPEHAAANVLMQLSDGSFVEKVGDYCYQAKPGADLRADIFSMKPVPCGEDKNAALYNRIMRKVGQDR
ncbi:hypothetical protein EOE67_06675 [Rheinheimera riviphila]|uniref:Uncharacterized protein n=1 Tax=Rheinheimera riviphila TaxID=1834037 RepID=A0A437R0H2_9GAMM|nr:hypothetical protein [Rheinheimera riviphila]RVU40274.1 hypothetical protein EOE67_06675 [Rheinheimera riviphila]